MICITIAQESRKLAMVDMLNAVHMGADLIEIRLDCFEKDPQLSELFNAKRNKPLLFSCRRPQDGGNWQGTEEERLMLLRQAIINKADYVEIEWDVADQIRPFPGSQRVISYTNLKETPSDIADIYATMQTRKPDVIKLTCKARTPEEAWPLVQILAKPAVPTVVVGLGRPGVMLAVLGRKIGAPWTVAALEKGMEVYPGQPTIRDLETIYAYRTIGKSTKLIGVTGVGENEFLLTGLLNKALEQLNIPLRVLPLQIGDTKIFRKIIDAVKLQAVALEGDWFGKAHSLGMYDDSAKPPVQAADLLLPREGQWQATNVFGSAIASALARTLRDKTGEAEPLRGRQVLLAGAGPMARMAAAPLKALGAGLMFSSRDRAASLALGQALGGRQVQAEAIYTTMHDVLIICGDRKSGDEDDDDFKVHPGYLRSGMAVLDLTAMPRQTPFLREAAKRGCTTVLPRRILVEHVLLQVQCITGQTGEFEPLAEAIDGWLWDDDEEPSDE